MDQQYSPDNPFASFVPGSQTPDPNGYSPNNPFRAAVAADKVKPPVEKPPTDPLQNLSEPGVKPDFIQSSEKRAATAQHSLETIIQGNLGDQKFEPKVQDDPLLYRASLARRIDQTGLQDAQAQLEKKYPKGSIVQVPSPSGNVTVYRRSPDEPYRYLGSGADFIGSNINLKNAGILGASVISPEAGVARVAASGALGGAIGQWLDYKSSTYGGYGKDLTSANIALRELGAAAEGSANAIPGLAKAFSDFKNSGIVFSLGDNAPAIINNTAAAGLPPLAQGQLSRSPFWQTLMRQSGATNTVLQKLTFRQKEGLFSAITRNLTNTNFAGTSPEVLHGLAEIQRSELMKSVATEGESLNKSDLGQLVQTALQNYGKLEQTALTQEKATLANAFKSEQGEISIAPVKTAAAKIERGIVGPPMPQSETLTKLNQYAKAAVDGNIVKGVSLVGSTATKGAGNDVDLLYDFGNIPLSQKSDLAAEQVTNLIEKSNIDLDKFDTFIKVGDRYFYVAKGAGREVVENTNYASEQAGKTVIKLGKDEEPVQLAGPTPEIQPYIATIKALAPKLANFTWKGTTDDAFSQFIEMRKGLYGLMTSSPDAATKAQARELFNATYDTIANTENYSPVLGTAIRSWLKRASTLQDTMEYFGTLPYKTEPGNVATALISPSKFNTTKALLGTLTPEERAQFTDGFRADLIANPNNLESRLNAFNNDKATLRLVVSAQDEASLRAYARANARLNQTIAARAGTSNVSSAANALALARNGTEDELNGLVKAAGNNPSTVNDIREGLYLDLANAGKETTKDGTFANPKAIYDATSFYLSRAGSELKNILTPGDIQNLKDWQHYASVLMETTQTDTAGSLQRGEAIAELKKPYKWFDDPKSTVGKIYQLVNNLGWAKVMAKPAAAKLITDSDPTTLQLTGRRLSRLATAMSIAATVNPNDIGRPQGPIMNNK